MHSLAEAKQIAQTC